MAFLLLGCIYVLFFITFEQLNILDMKKLLFLFIMVGLLVTTSCNRHNPQPANKSITELTVADDFDWQTSTNINFQIKKAASGVITITSEDGSVLFHKGFYNGLGDSYNVSVNLPKYITRVLVNNKAVDISGSGSNLL